MRLANSGAGRNAPLHGLHGILAHPCPRTRKELLVFTSMFFTCIPDHILMFAIVAQCNITTAHLGLPNLAPNPLPTVTARRQQIAEYLGVTLD